MRKVNKRVIIVSIVLMVTPTALKVLLKSTFKVWQQSGEAKIEVQVQTNLLRGESVFIIEEERTSHQRINNVNGLANSLESVAEFDVIKVMLMWSFQDRKTKQHLRLKIFLFVFCLFFIRDEPTSNVNDFANSLENVVEYDIKSMLMW